MKVLVLVVMMVVTVVMTTATTTKDKGLFGCTYDEPKPFNLRTLADWKLAISVCNKEVTNYTACTNHLGVCIDYLEKMNGEMTEDEWTTVKKHYQDCGNSQNATINVQAFRDLDAIHRSCPSIDWLMDDLGFTPFNFFPLYKCVAEKADPVEFKNFKDCTNGP